MKVRAMACGSSTLVETAIGMEAATTVMAVPLGGTIRAKKAPTSM